MHRCSVKKKTLWSAYGTEEQEAPPTCLLDPQRTKRHVGGTDLTSTTEVCALCCDTLKKGQDVLKCEGSCGCNVHRYCAGVTKLYFDELVKGSIPFVCQYCALNIYKAIVQQLQDEVASLKLELAETKSLCERRSQTHPPASYASVASKEPLSKQPAKHGGQKGQKGQRPPAKQPTLLALVPHSHLPGELLVSQDLSIMVLVGQGSGLMEPAESGGP